MTTSKSKILFMMTGSIACYKACGVISQLVKKGFHVQVAASASALKFVGSPTLEGLSGRPVVNDLWSAGSMMDHIHLVRECDLIVVAPATANFINKIAHGVGDDLLATMFLAHDFKKPFLLAPAMNTSMYQHPLTQKSIQNLRCLGVQVLETASGVLACGESGEGKLLEPDAIIAEIEKALSPQSQNRPRVLVTAGGTAEPIDGVRVLTNKSTGRTGAQIADVLIERGWPVTFVHAERSALPRHRCDQVSFASFNDLSDRLQELLRSNDYGAVIHTAAVSDYSIRDARPGEKISSENDELTLHLKKNPKLVDQLREFSKNSDLKVIAFKMTADTRSAAQALAVEKLFSHSHADLVIHNDIHEMDSALGKHIFRWWEPNKSFESTVRLEDTESLSLKLAQYLSQELQ